ncbi:MAG: conjugal transfer protein TraX [Oscillospiraceae bacterium]|nr:conjugal transfer protein TraX [Oscillospiraceae bacterium]
MMIINRLTALTGSVSRSLNKSMTSRPDRPWYGLNENTDLLKCIAMITMIIDHTAEIFFPRHYGLRMIGRVSFPLFCWCMVVGADYTKNIGKYALRLLVLAIVSQPAFMLALNHSLWDFNIFVTLLLGLIGIAGIQRGRFEAPILALLISCFYRMDYGFRGVACILTMYMLRKNPFFFSIGFTLFCAAWGMGAAYNSPFYAVLRYWGGTSMTVGSFLGSSIRMQSLAVCALPLILIPTRKRWRWLGGGKWFYMIYPAHLWILYAIKRLV